MTGSSVWATFSINGVFFVGLMSLFEYYRNKITDLYAPRSRGNNPKYGKPKDGYFQWIIQLYNIDDEETFRIAGMDGYVFLRFIAFCCRLTSICGFFAAFALIPIYATSPAEAIVNGIDTISMANLNQRGKRLWASFTFSYLFTCVFLYLIHKEYEHFVAMRKKYFHGTVDIIPLQTRYTVQVENIPPELRSSDKLFEVFNGLFPGEVLFTHLAISTPVLDQLIIERNAVRDQLERAIAQFEGSNKKDRPILDLKIFNPQRYRVTKEVDQISFLTKRLHKLCMRTAKLQKAITDVGEPVELPDSPVPPAPQTAEDLQPRRSDSPEHYDDDSVDSEHSDDEGDSYRESTVQPSYNPLQGPLSLRKFSHILEDVKSGIKELLFSTTGFVTFKTRKAQLTAVKTSVLLEQYSHMMVVPAPPPVDVIWSNISASTRVTEQTAVLSEGMYYGCLGIWGGVMAFVAAISTMSTLEEYIPAIRNMNDWAYAVMEGILPVIVVLTFSTIVSEVISFIARNIEKRKTNSAVEMEVFRWYFMYQMANIYLILVAGSVWQSVVQAIERPAAIITYLSAALPSVSSFFINYIITVWLSGVPYKLVRRFRALEYLFHWFTHLPQNTTRRMMKDGPFRHTRVQYGTELSDILYILCVVLLYWVISPVVLLFAVPLFWSWYFVWKYELVFVVTRAYESGGVLWYRIYQYAMTGLLAGNIVFITYMGIKEGVSQGPLLVPLPLIIIVCWRHTETQFKFQSEAMPFDLAIRDDFGDDLRGAPQECKCATFNANFMKQPNLTCAAEIFPYPYRINGIPLFDQHGALSEVYVDDIPDPIDISPHGGATMFRKNQVSATVAPRYDDMDSSV